MYDYISEFNPCFDVYDSKAFFCNLVAQPTLLNKVIEAQGEDEKIEGIHSLITAGKKIEEWSIRFNLCS